MSARGAALGLAAAGAVILGFVFGFAWGARVREELPAATDTDFSGGVLTVKVNAGRAVTRGLASLF